MLNQGKGLFGFKLPIKIILVVILVIFTSFPAVMSWLWISQTINRSIYNHQFQAEYTLNDTLLQLRMHMVENALINVHMEIFHPPEVATVYMMGKLRQSRFVKWDAQQILLNVRKVVSEFWDFVYFLQSSPHMTIAGVAVNSNTTYDSMGVPSSIQQVNGCTRLNVDLVTGELTVHYYETISLLNVYGNESWDVGYYLDVITGLPLFAVYNTSYRGMRKLGPIRTSTIDATRGEYIEWVDNVEFNPRTGLPQIYIRGGISLPDRLASIGVEFYTSIYEVSDVLNAILKSPWDRLYMMLNTAQGTLIGASHGKFFSQSDIDWRVNNAVTNPPPTSSFRTYTAVNSTDDVIAASARWLLGTYHSWDRVPSMTVEVTLNNDVHYWISVTLWKSEYGLPTALVMLMNVNSYLGVINAQKINVTNIIYKFNSILLGLFLAIMLSSTSLAVMISIFISRSLYQLEKQLRFLSRLDVSYQTKLSLSRITSIHKCQRSFIKLERAMKAFVKFVPSDMVMSMLSEGVSQISTRRASNVYASFQANLTPTWELLLVKRRVITVMFSDIAGFSTICETISPELLMSVMSEYLKQMGMIIQAHSGTLDKFIGDCIMAMWNAPGYVVNHEASACFAALEMQQALMRLNDIWEENLVEAIPAFRFRTGINTTLAFVGNFGCAHRISYTCIGEGVHLASQLDSFTKKFGTVTLVTERTKAASCGEIFFRKIGVVEVPGVSDMVTLYEPLFFNCADHLDGGTTGFECSQEELVPYCFEMVSKRTLQAMVTSYHLGLQFIEQEKYMDAILHFKESASYLPRHSVPCQRMIEECCAQLGALAYPVHLSSCFSFPFSPFLPPTGANLDATSSRVSNITDSTVAMTPSAGQRSRFSQVESFHGILPVNSMN